VDGFDPVEWEEAESSGRRRGGTPAAKAAPPAKKAPKPAARAETPPAAEEQPVPRRSREPGNRRGGREDAGPREPVVGFGDDIPAFMQIRRRARPAAGPDTDGQDGKDQNEDTEIAA
jgi:hypothetical protein